MRALCANRTSRLLLLRKASALRRQEVLFAAAAGSRRRLLPGAVSTSTSRFYSARPLAEEEQYDDEADQDKPVAQQQLKKKRAVGIPQRPQQQRQQQQTLPKEKEKTKKEKDGGPSSSPSSSPSPYESPSMLTYTGGVTVPITTRLRIVTPEDDTPRGTWPVFRLVDENGRFRDPAFDTADVNYGPDGKGGGGGPPPVTESPAKTIPGDNHNPRDLESLRSFLQEVYPFHAEEFQKNGLLFPAKHPYADMPVAAVTAVAATDDEEHQPHQQRFVADNTLLRAFRQMLRLKQMDTILQNAQRQGRISFYMTCRGEEAIHMGAGSALEVGDPIFAQYREQGLLMWRGFSLEQFTNQCFSNAADLGKGRQMPVHYGSRALNYHTVSSPLGTQLPQAVGAAYKLKLEGKPNKNVVACFFGDGCASTTDFHSALNFAAALQAPVLFVCRNNGYAISTPITDQYAGDGIVSRAPGYGMAGIRVDGNDIFAVHAAIREAKAYSLEHSAPVLVECMTYRQGHHSTSDDSTRYRPAEEVHALSSQHDPIKRLSNFLAAHTDWMSPHDKATIKDEERLAVLKAMEAAERRPPPPIESLFEDVYAEMPPHLREQQAQLQAHIRKYPKRYNKK